MTVDNHNFQELFDKFDEYPSTSPFLRELTCNRRDTGVSRETWKLLSSDLYRSLKLVTNRGPIHTHEDNLKSYRPGSTRGKGKPVKILREDCQNIQCEIFYRLGVCNYMLDRRKHAARHFSMSLKLANNIVNKLCCLKNCIILADILMECNDKEGAIEKMLYAQKLCRHLYPRTNITTGCVLVRMGDIYCSMQDLHASLLAYISALEICSRLSSENEELSLRTEVGITSIYLQYNNVSEARNRLYELQFRCEIFYQETKTLESGQLWVRVIAMCAEVKKKNFLFLEAFDELSLAYEKSCEIHGGNQNEDCISLQFGMAELEMENKSFMASLPLWKSGMLLLDCMDSLRHSTTTKHLMRFLKIVETSPNVEVSQVMDVVLSVVKSLSVFDLNLLKSLLCCCKEMMKIGKLDKVREILNVLEEFTMGFTAEIPAAFILAIANFSLMIGNHETCRELFLKIVQDDHDNFKFDALLGLAAIAIRCSDFQKGLKILIQANQLKRKLSLSERIGVLHDIIKCRIQLGHEENFLAGELEQFVCHGQKVVEPCCLITKNFQDMRNTLKYFEKSSPLWCFLEAVNILTEKFLRKNKKPFSFHKYLL